MLGYVLSHAFGALRTGVCCVARYGIFTHGGPGMAGAGLGCSKDPALLAGSVGRDAISYTALLAACGRVPLLRFFCPGHAQETLSRTSGATRCNGFLKSVAHIDMHHGFIAVGRSFRDSCGLECRVLNTPVMVTAAGACRETLPGALIGRA